MLMNLKLGILWYDRVYLFVLQLVNQFPYCCLLSSLTSPSFICDASFIVQLAHMYEIYFFACDSELSYFIDLFFRYPEGVIVLN